MLNRHYMRRIATDMHHHAQLAHRIARAGELTQRDIALNEQERHVGYDAVMAFGNPRAPNRRGTTRTSR